MKPRRTEGDGRPGARGGRVGSLAGVSNLSSLPLPSVVAALPFPIWKIVVALVAAGILVRIGMKTLGGFARPVPQPPDPGELRRVRLTYECPICLTTVRMTMANDEVPEPPRHCMEDMILKTPLEDI